MAANAIDPRLYEESSQNQPQNQPQTDAPSRGFDNADEDDFDDEGTEGSEKRRKLNLWKCKQCRDARKKCLPEDRVWPQKCQRCLQHRPNVLECSEPQLNTRKRGPNLDKSKPTHRLKNSRSTPDTEMGAKYKEELQPDTPMVSGRPIRQPVLPRSIKREPPETNPFIESRPTPANDEVYPASAFLPLGEGECRVLRLPPGNKEAPVAFSFTTVSMSQPIDYEAISYVWAGDDKTQPEMKSVEIRDAQGKSYPFSTKTTVYAALQHLRDPEQTKLFWVDALCINRSDNAELNQQIAMKRYIFHKATNLCFWLGDNATYRSALAFVNARILDLTGIDKVVRDDTTIEKWVAFVALLKNPAFGRLWLVQEVAVARNVTVHCGQSGIHYGDLVDAVATFVSLRSDICLLFRRNHKKCKDLMDHKMTIAERFIDISTNAVRFSSTGKVQRLLSLEALVSQLSDLSSGNPRDRIFSVLALAKDGPKVANETLMEYPKNTQDEGALRIDYYKSTLEVYQSFVVHAIKQSGSLDIICRHWASSVSERDVTLPTWVRPLQSSLQLPFENSSERSIADSLVGLPDHTYYHASRGTVAITEGLVGNDDNMNELKSLAVRGRRLDTISRLGPRASEGVIQYEWLELGGCTTMETTATAPDSFWRTLVADRGPHGSNAPSWYHRAFEYCLHHLTPTGDINTNKLIEENEAESSLVVDFLQRVQSVVWNRKFLVSRNNGWIGLAPMAAQVGDILFVLNGCSVPVVLRQGIDGRFQFVGECYIHGMMDGEAVEAVGVYEENFELR